MRVIHVPISEMLCPPKKSRKLRCRSARHACDAPLGGRAACALRRSVVDAPFAFPEPLKTDASLTFFENSAKSMAFFLL
jgi:hypothetical protein